MESSLDLSFLHADACSFAAAMAQSGELTVARIEAGRKLFELHCVRHGGRVVDEVGDSILLTFNSVDAAYAAALATTQEINLSHHRLAEQQPFQYRIGITQGRVHVSGGSFYGHCINQAARIGSLVKKGNIGVEASVWSKASKHVTGANWNKRRLFVKPDEPFVEFVEVEMGMAVATSSLMNSFSWNEPLVAIFQHDSGSSASERKQEAALFEALNWEFGSYFSSYGWRTQVHVVEAASPNPLTSPADYVVRCGAVLSRSRSRVFASLNSPHLKGGIQTFSRDAEQVQESLVQIMALVSLVGSAIAQSERDRAKNMKAVGIHQLVAAGRTAIANFSEAGFAEGMKLLENARLLNPDYPLLKSTLGRAQAIAWRFGWNGKHSGQLELARSQCEVAHALEPDDARCEGDLAFVKFWSGETDEAVWHYERSVEILPYHAELAADAGMVLGYTGQSEKAARILERSVANIPNDVDYRLWSLGDVYHSMKDYKRSLSWLSRMRDKSQAQRLMAVNKVLLGLDPSHHVANVLEKQPDFSVRHWVGIQPFTNESERIDFEEALLQAGLPT